LCVRWFLRYKLSLRDLVEMMAFGNGGLAIFVIPCDGAAPAREQNQNVHTPQLIDQELARLTKDLELTSGQQQQVKALLQDHHDRIQALLDQNLSATRQELGSQIHAISDETHHKIHALLSDRQRQLEKAMQKREHNGEENRRPDPPATASPEPSSSAS
jgi:hypothetical protein